MSPVGSDFRLLGASEIALRLADISLRRQDPAPRVACR